MENTVRSKFAAIHNFSMRMRSQVGLAAVEKQACAIAEFVKALPVFAASGFPVPPLLNSCFGEAFNVVRTPSKFANILRLNIFNDRGRISNPGFARDVHQRLVVDDAD